MFKKKKSLFNYDTAMPDTFAEDYSVEITEADGGFTLRCRGGKDNMSKPKVATSIEDALDIAKKHLSKSSKED